MRIVEPKLPPRWASEQAALYLKPAVCSIEYGGGGCGGGGALFDDLSDPYAVENLRQTIAVLTPGQAATIDRDRAISLLEELQRLQHERLHLVSQLRGVLGRLDE